MQPDERYGGPELDRQLRPERLDVHGRLFVPSRVPEVRPTPLQDVFIYLSIGVLISGVVAIAALELGTPLSSPAVKVPVLVGGGLLVAVTIDAIVRIWRSARAWSTIDRGRSLARRGWAALLALSLLATFAIMGVILVA
jgi:hypothetical protein